MSEETKKIELTEQELDQVAGGMRKVLILTQSEELPLGRHLAPGNGKDQVKGATTPVPTVPSIAGTPNAG